LEAIMHQSKYMFYEEAWYNFLDISYFNFLATWQRGFFVEIRVEITDVTVILFVLDLNNLL